MEDGGDIQNQYTQTQDMFVNWLYIDKAKAWAMKLWQKCVKGGQWTRDVFNNFACELMELDTMTGAVRHAFDISKLRVGNFFSSFWKQEDNGTQTLPDDTVGNSLGTAVLDGVTNIDRPSDGSPEAAGLRKKLEWLKKGTRRKCCKGTRKQRKKCCRIR